MIFNILTMFQKKHRPNRDTDKEVADIMRPVKKQAEDIKKKTYQISRIARTVVFEVSQVTNNR